MSLRSWVAWQGKDLVYGHLGKLLWPRCSAIVVVEDGGEMLAIDTGDYLMLPGGGLESGESFVEAAEREAEEETGVEIEVEEEIWSGENSVGGVEKVFRASPRSKDTGSHWEGEPQWIDLEQARERKWRHDRDVEKLLERL